MCSQNYNSRYDPTIDRLMGNGSGYAHFNISHFMMINMFIILRNFC